jgi:hypothetical protein
MKTKRTVLLGVVVLALAALAVAAYGLAAVGPALAQDDTPPAQEDDGGESGERVIEREVVAVNGDVSVGLGFPFEQALRQLVGAGTLTHEDVDAIMADLSALTDAVDYQSSTSPDGNEHQVEITITIAGDDGALRDAMAQALDNAVAAGLLTTEEAADVQAQVDAAPDAEALLLPGDGSAHRVFAGDDAALLDLIDERLQARLDAAVDDGAITAEEAATFRDILARLLADE